MKRCFECLTKLLKALIILGENQSRSSPNFMIIRITYPNLLHGNDFLCFLFMNYSWILERVNSVTLGIYRHPADNYDQNLLNYPVDRALHSEQQRLVLIIIVHSCGVCTEMQAIGCELELFLNYVTVCLLRSHLLGCHATLPRKGKRCVTSRKTTAKGTTH